MAMTDAYHTVLRLRRFYPEGNSETNRDVAQEIREMAQKIRTIEFRTSSDRGPGNQSMSFS